MILIPLTIRGSRKRVIRLTAQEKRLRVMRFMGRSSSLMMGLTILLSNNQMIAAVIRVLAS
jgi:hypothetical protein